MLLPGVRAPRSSVVSYRAVGDEGRALLLGGENGGEHREKWAIASDPSLAESARYPKASSVRHVISRIAFLVVDDQHELAVPHRKVDHLVARFVQGRRHGRRKVEGTPELRRI